jgi:hypothetical protein
MKKYVTPIHGSNGVTHPSLTPFFLNQVPFAFRTSSIGSTQTMQNCPGAISVVEK